MKLELRQTLISEGEDELEIKPGLSQKQWYAIQMSEIYQLKREMRELRAEESIGYLKRLNQIDEGAGHFIHSIWG